MLVLGVYDEEEAAGGSFRFLCSQTPGHATLAAEGALV